MTPQNIAAAAPLVQELANLERFQEAASRARTASIVLHGSDSLPKAARECLDGTPVEIPREQAVRVFQMLIDQKRREMRDLGVVFPDEPQAEPPAPRGRDVVVPPVAQVDCRDPIGCSHDGFCSCGS